MKFLSRDFVELIGCCDRHEVRFLIANKRAAGRPQDLVDADVLDHHDR